MDLVLVVHHVDAVALVAPQVGVQTLIVAKTINLINEGSMAGLWLLLEALVAAWAFDVALLRRTGSSMGGWLLVLLNKRPQVSVQVLFGVEEAHRVRQLDDVIFELDKLLALLHGDELLLLVQLSAVSCCLVEPIAVNISIGCAILIDVLLLVLIWSRASALIIEVSVDPVVVRAGGLSLADVASLASALAHTQVVGVLSRLLRLVGQIAAKPSL